LLVPVPRLVPVPCVVPNYISSMVYRSGKRNIDHGACFERAKTSNLPGRIDMDLHNYNMFRDRHSHLRIDDTHKVWLFKVWICYKRYRQIQFSYRSAVYTWSSM
jgi:hypothetical protein